jgi:hypothetical protein
MAGTGTPEKKAAKKIALAKAQKGRKLVTRMLNAFIRGKGLSGLFFMRGGAKERYTPFARQTPQNLTV